MSDLGRHGFSPTTATEQGINSTLVTGDPHLKKSDVVVQLEQQPGHQDLCLFKVDLDARSTAAKTSTTSAVALTATPQLDGVSKQDGQMLEHMIMGMPQDSNNTPGEVTVAETECHRAKIKYKPQQHASNPLEEDKPSTTAGRSSPEVGASSLGTYYISPWTGASFLVTEDFSSGIGTRPSTVRIL